ncbi:methyltransferase-like protein 27 [Lytechinus variegatus]|uniref:methyltransferase-like protein 27 n=1 Tax=Lytechinus variegatus TaxID=7654 RepID=UPI001BB1A071|nr:methyltransferase-like protein 27 [Lytechinus variegatus]XP_041463598.1 methyltransferase-like protein 27 [Lytechinus variegatus]
MAKNSEELAMHYRELTKARPVSGDPQKVVERYDELAATYDEHSKFVGYSAPAGACRRVCEVVTSKDSLILDVGCGTGMLGELLNKEGYSNLYGLDPSERSCDVARSKGCYATVIQGVARPDSPLSFNDGHFDALVSSGTFQPGHCDQNDIPELIRLLRPSGFMVISTRKASLNETDSYRVKSTLKHYVDTGVLQEFSYQEFDDYFGFATEDVTGIVLTYKKK